MKIVVLLSIVFSLNAFAESQKCNEVLYKSNKFETQALDALERAYANAESAQNADTLIEKCNYYKNGSYDMFVAATAMKDLKKVSMEAILNCNETVSKQNIVRQLNFVFDNLADAIDAQQAMTSERIEIGCLQL